MAVNMKLAGLAVIGLGAALAGAYQVGRSAAVNNAAALQAPVAQATRPAAHPPVAEDQRQGKVGADPAQKFTHFRVGNKNVKRIFVDGDTVWVGTSGGAVRSSTAYFGDRDRSAARCATTPGPTNTSCST